MDKVYRFSNAQVKESNPRFSMLGLPVELVFERYSSIVECPDDGSIPARSFDFTVIGALELEAKDVT